MFRTLSSRLAAALFFLTITSSLYAIAQIKIPTGKAKGSYTITHDGMVFDARGGQYVLSAVTTHTNGSAQLTILGLTKKLPYAKTTTAVLGREKRGSLTLRLARAGSGAQLSVSIIVNETAQGKPLKGHVEYVLPLAFTQGTWTDYEAGRNVTLGFTPEAAEIYTSSMSDFMLKVIVDGLIGGIQGVNLEPSIDNITILNNPVIRANLQQISVPSLATKYDLRLNSSVGTR